MQLSEANQLLNSLYSPFESGWKRLDSGVIHIAVRTPMPGVAPEMIDWWLGFLHHTEEYKWWHPRDHVWSDWEVAAPPRRIHWPHPSRPRICRRASGEAPHLLQRPRRNTRQEALQGCECRNGRMGLCWRDRGNKLSRPPSSLGSTDA